MKSKFIKSLQIIFLTIFLGCHSNSSTPTDQFKSGNPELRETPIGALPFKKVFFIIFENTNASDALRQPYLAKLAKAGAYLNNMKALTHPSQGNYIALTAGERGGVKGDEKVNLDITNISHLLSASGRSWKSYAEDYPGNCFLGNSGKYRRKHEPFISFVNVQNDPKLCSRIVNAEELWTDIKNKNIPDYSFYVPNLDNDGHDTGIAFAANWLEQTFDPVFSNAEIMKDVLFILTFDEDAGSAQNKIYTTFLGAGVRPGVVSNKPYDTYSMLRTVEEGLGIGTLGKNDAKAVVIDDVWK